ncbi:MAG: Acylphosphatase [Candidatus Methanogaster sp.]|nr:MAG: Acylphosphatase [ANME-2 cluster archaeon]
MIRADITVTGDVQRVGFRTFIKNLADSLNIKGYAKNLNDGSVNIVCESEKNNIEELINELRENPPSFASIGDVYVKYADCTGEYVSFERTNGDVPKEATLGDLLGVMQSFDTKAEALVTILGDMHVTLKSVKRDTGLTLDKQDQMLDKQDQMLDKQDQMLNKQDQMLDKQDQMLDKQDTTIQVLKDVKGDTGQIKGIKEDTEVMKDKLTSIEEIHKELRDLRVKYNQLSDDVTEIKIAISELSESRVSVPA